MCPACISAATFIMSRGAAGLMDATSNARGVWASAATAVNARQTVNLRTVFRISSSTLTQLVPRSKWPAAASAHAPRRRPAFPPLQEVKCRTSGDRRVLGCHFVAAHQVDDQQVEETADSPVELLFRVQFHAVLVEGMLLHIVQQGLSQHAQVAHAFVQRNTLLKSFPACVLVAAHHGFAISRGQPVTQALQQLPMPLP